MTDTLTRALRAADQGVNLGADGMGWSPDPTLYRQAADEIDRLTAALAAASAPGVPAGIVPATETAWLVEWKAHGFGPQWWGFNYEPGKRGMWCSDANNAVRFARKEDALRMRLHVIAVAGLTGRHTYEGGISVTEHEWCDGRSDALSASPPPPTEQKAVAPAMTPWRAAYFMERFLHEEKMLGPNEQAALRFVIAMLETTPPPTEQSEQARPGGISARACEWDQDSSAQWTDRYYGFSIIEEQGDELPFSAAWGEDDGEQFATLEEAKAWCQSQVDGWIAKYAVLPGQQSEQARQPLTDGWRPIESAPRDGSLFLCWVSAVRYGETDEGQQHQQDASQVDFCNWRTQADIPDCGWFEPCCGQIGDSQDVTHWQPLPAPPIEPAKDAG